MLIFNLKIQLHLRCYKALYTATEIEATKSLAILIARVAMSGNNRKTSEGIDVHVLCNIEYIMNIGIEIQKTCIILLSPIVERSLTTPLLPEIELELGPNTEWSITIIINPHTKISTNGKLFFLS